MPTARIPRVGTPVLAALLGFVIPTGLRMFRERGYKLPRWSTAPPPVLTKSA